MSGTLKVTASLGVTNTKLKVHAQAWHIRDNIEPIRLAWENHHGPLTEGEKVMPIVDEGYIEKSIAWHMYLAQLEQQERKEKWERASTNLSMISGLPPTS